jgi:hypothetical protein
MDLINDLTNRLLPPSQSGKKVMFLSQIARQWLQVTGGVFHPFPLARHVKYVIS